MNYEEISKKYNIKVSILTRRVHVLKIKGVFKGRKVYFTKNQISQLIEYNPRFHFERGSNINHSRKLSIIEFYNKLKSGRKVAAFLHISRPIVDAAIKEYNETGSITVESRLNKEEYEMDNVNLV